MNIKKEFTPTAYSEWINNFLAESGMSSYKLDSLCGVSQVTIDRIRSGESQSPARTTIKKLEKVIDTPSPDARPEKTEEDPGSYTGEVIEIVSYTINEAAMTEALDKLDKEFPDWRKKENSMQSMLIKPFYEGIINAKDGNNTTSTTSSH